MLPIGNIILLRKEAVLQAPQPQSAKQEWKQRDHAANLMPHIYRKGE
jgi:hypothetical protein